MFKKFVKMLIIVIFTVLVISPNMVCESPKHVHEEGMCLGNSVRY